ncbi:MAG TPA: PIG-L family deacetylase [Coriobacteriia bacterium]
MSTGRRRSNKSRYFVAAAGGAVALGLAYLFARSASSDPAPTLAANLEAASLGDRVLVIAPHPDDEVMTPGGLIARCRDRGAQVKVVLLTVGDGYRRAAQRIAKGALTPETYRELGRLRAAESGRALGQLGVPAEDRVYLGYADGSLNSLWELEWDPDRPHVGANGSPVVPYDFAFRPGAVCCGADLVADLERTVTDFEPTAIVYPDPDDSHHDHWASAAFVDYCLEDLGYAGDRYTYVTHFYHYPFPWAHMSSAFVRPPEGLLQVGTRWHTLALDEETQSRKRRAIDAFATQLSVPDLRVYLLAFDRRNELFGTFARRSASSVSSDEVPRGVEDDPGDRVVIEPPPAALERLRGRRGVIRDVRFVRGPHTSWLGVRTFDGAPADLRYDLHLRLFGGGQVPSRLDISVTGDSARVVTAASGSVQPASVRTERAGDTVWVSVPSDLLERRTSAMAAAESHPGPGEWTGSRSAWRPFAL